MTLRFGNKFREVWNKIVTNRVSLCCSVMKSGRRHLCRHTNTRANSAPRNTALNTPIAIATTKSITGFPQHFGFRTFQKKKKAPNNTLKLLIYEQVIFNMCNYKKYVHVSGCVTFKTKWYSCSALKTCLQSWVHFCCCFRSKTCSINTLQYTQSQ